MNERKTLQNLHKVFPDMSLDDLFKILDCYVNEYQISSPHYGWRDSNINSTDDKIRQPITGNIAYYTGSRE